MTTKEIIELIRALRKKKNFTQKQLAEALGISVAQYGHYETQHSEMSISIFLKILEILSVSVQDFFSLATNKITREDIKELKAIVKKLEGKLD